MLPSIQFEFRGKDSTMEQIHLVVNSISPVLENKEFASAIFLDISNAFDKVWHEDHYTTSWSRSLQRYENSYDRISMDIVSALTSKQQSIHQHQSPPESHEEVSLAQNYFYFIQEAFQ